ncbi:ABC transporter permease [Dactylosporangium sp. AC04546]|uniref:ABC transporter permease n=1 Tax=Dactylosporangium sp. AC04546 TaxID=2862460 RepID=UPI001EE0AE56|nr:ABC transporter permease [Dactylosporangium sp. AC04546]WVK86809.1 ABC transporter permease [Dactylosporangium sp. AC04546]
MTRYILQRVALLVPVLLGVSVLVFMSLYLTPGDPVTAVVGDVPVSEETRQQLRAQYGFDRPLWDQYLSFMGRALQGDLGYSYRYQRPVLDLVLQNIPQTIQLMLAAMVIAVLLGSLIGTASALKRGSKVDTALMGLATLGLSVPTFWLGMILLLVFAVNLRWLPAIGADRPGAIILPAVTLAIGAACIIARFLRGSLLEVLNHDYVVTARSKGMRERRVIGVHAMRNAVIPVLTIVGLQIGNLLAGAVVVETIFTRHGIGQLLLSGITNRDFPIVQGTVLFATVSYVLVNLVVDLLYTVVDPRIRHGGKPS